MNLSLSLSLMTQSALSGAGGGGFMPESFPFSTAKFAGDSRTASAGDYVNNGSSVTVTIGLTGVASAGLIQSLSGNPFLLRQGFQHGVGATTSRAHEERDKSTSIATTGNPAFTDTAVAADAQFSIRSDGAASALTQVGNHIFSSAVGVNDTTATAFYDTPSTAWQTLRTIARIADAYGTSGKVWYVGNEFPRGDTFYPMEAKTVAGGAVTATNTVNFVDGEVFGVTGVIGLFATGLPRPLAKVASAPGQDQYTVSAAGVYTFGGTAPTNAWISYSATPPAGRLNTPDQIKIINEFCNSSAANFVSTVNSVDYGIPGLQFNRPWVRVVDTFGALVDGATGSDQRLKLGTGDVLRGLHLQGYGQYLSGKAFAAKVAADYPVTPDLSGAPTRNNWYAARGSGVGTVFTGTLPTTMRTGFTITPAPTILSINGAVVGSVNTATGAITGATIVSGSLDFATGVWTVTFDLATRMPANAQLWFEQDIGNFVVATLTEGTVGRNPVMNGLLDPFTATGTGLITVNGTSSVSGITSASIPYGWVFSNTALNDAIIAGTAAAAVTNGTDADGFPMFLLDMEGRHTTGFVPQLSTGTINNYTARVTAGDQVMFGANVRHARHPTVAKHYGNNGYTGQIALFLTGSVSRPSQTGPQNVTALTSRVHDQGTGLYQVDEQIMRDEGGTWDQYRVSPLLDTTGAVISNPQCTLTLGRSVANVPVAVRMGVGRVQGGRRRGDVA